MNKLPFKQEEIQAINLWGILRRNKGVLKYSIPRKRLNIIALCIHTNEREPGLPFLRGDCECHSRCKKVFYASATAERKGHFRVNLLFQNESSY